MNERTTERERERERERKRQTEYGDEGEKVKVS